MYPYADQPEYLWCAVSVCGKLNPWRGQVMGGSHFIYVVALSHNLPFRFYVVLWVLWVHCHGISLHVVRRRDMCLPVPTSHGWQYNLPGNFHVRNACEHIHPGSKVCAQSLIGKIHTSLPHAQWYVGCLHRFSQSATLKVRQLLGLWHTTSFGLRLGQLQRVFTPGWGFTRVRLDPSLIHK
jgi:hypothetical protein